MDSPINAAPSRNQLTDLSEETSLSTQSKPTRRSFFAGLGAVAAAGVAVKLASKAPEPVAAAPEAVEPEGPGYRLSEHIKKYYRTAKI
jgi:hypothetical protein